MRIQVRMPGHDTNRSLGHLAVAWIEYWVRHGEGSVQGQKQVLDQDFYDFVVDAYCLDATGRRLYRTCVLSRPKGTSKSELAGGITLFETLGPARFKGWAEGGEVFEWEGFTYTYAAGEPMGRLVQSPFARLLATERKQTGNTYQNVFHNLDDGDVFPLANVPGIDAGTTRTNLPNSGRIWPSTAASSSADGGLETFAVADESHLYTTTELRSMYNTVRRNLRKRKADEPWFLVTTTMFRDGENSQAQAQHKAALAVLEGKIKGFGLLFDHVEGGVIEDLGDEKLLRKVLREAFADRDWIDYDAYVADTLDPTVDPSDFRRYTLNQQAASATSFVTSAEMSAANLIDGEPVEPLKKGDIITVGMDFAPGNITAGKKKFHIPDATALIACRLSDMSLHPLGVWEASEAAATRGWNPPMNEIEQTVHAAFKDYKIVGFFSDPAHIQDYLNKWTARYLSHLKIKASADRPMYRWMSGELTSRNGRDIDSLYVALASGQLHVVESAVLTRHFLNARRTVTKYGPALYKRNPESPDKIDAAVASVLAYAAAVQALNKGFGGAKKRTGVPRRIR